MTKDDMPLSTPTPNTKLESALLLPSTVAFLTWVVWKYHWHSGQFSNIAESDITNENTK